jgi:TonB family protein
MKLHTVAMFYIFLTVLAAVGVGQALPADSDPVMQGSASYSMPQSAIEAKIGGTVMVAIRVDETGKPLGAVVISGPSWPCDSKPVEALQELSTSISEAMMKLRFTPAIKNGKPIAKNIGLRLELKNALLAPELDPATGKPKYKQVAGGVLNGKAIQLPKPGYPAEARADREAGTVTIQILIDETGNVIRAGAVTGPPTLQLVSREAACSSKFSPTLLAGEPVKVTGVITYNFVP